MKRSLLVLALLPLLGFSARAAGDGIHTRVLPNGLRIVVKEDHSKPLAALRIYVGTGGAFEMEYLGCGISHYYEHLLSGGTTSTRPEAESARILQELGGQQNAYTSYNLTCYHIVTSPSAIGRAIDLYADWMMRNVLDPSEVAREKKVILKEINKGEDEPSRVLQKLFMETMFHVHPCRVPVIGYRELFEKLTRDDLLSYYRNRYAPTNTVVAVAGDVDPGEIFGLVEKSMGSWPRRPYPVVLLPEEPRQTAPRYAEKEMDVRQAMVRMGYHTIDLFDPDLYALDLAAAVLGQGRTSRLFRRVVERDRLAPGIQSYSWTPSWMKGVFGISFQTPVENLDRTLRAVKEEVERIRRGPVTPEELERAKVQVVAGYRTALQTVQDQAEQVGRDYLTTGNPRFSLDYTERIHSVTPEAVVAAARKHLRPEGLTVAVIRPLGSTAGRGEGERAAGRAAAAVRRVKLANGLILLVKDTPGVGPVGVEAFSLGGIRAEPAGKNGVSNLTARLLLKGTRTRSALDIARQVEDIGGTIGSQSGNNTIGVSLTLGRGARDLPFAGALLADILRNSTFPEEEFEKEKSLARQIAGRLDENWQSEAYWFLRKVLFADSPYARPTVGTPASVAGLSREDVREFARRFLRPEDTVVAVAGDVDVEATVQLFTGLFEDWKGTGPFLPPTPAKPEWAGGSLPRDRFAGKTNRKKQAVISIAFPAPRYADLEDRAALTVVDAFTSGIGLPSGWFHNALRGGERAYVYFVHFSVFPGLSAGFCYVYTQTEPRLMNDVFRILRAQIERLRKGEFTDRELETGRAMALVSAPYYAQTVNDMAQEIALPELYGLGFETPVRFREALLRVTRRDVMRVVDRYLTHMLVTVTGPEEAQRILREWEAKARAAAPGPGK